MLDEETKQGLTETLAALQDNTDRIIKAIDQHAGDSEALQLERQRTMSHQIDALANTISQQNEQTQASTVTQKVVHIELLDAIEHATTTNADGILDASESVCTVVKDENVDTRVAITDLVESNHEVMKQEINELQHGLQQLQIEISRKVDELKDLVLKINSTAEGAERRLLRKRGNTVTVTLMSLYELYRSLQVRAYPKSPAIACLNHTLGIIGVIATKRARSRRDHYQEDDIKRATGKSLYKNTHVSAQG